MLIIKEIKYKNLPFKKLKKVLLVLLMNIFRLKYRQQITAPNQKRQEAEC